jgi:hypothetical protein
MLTKYFISIYKIKSGFTCNYFKIQNYVLYKHKMHSIAYNIFM